MKQNVKETFDRQRYEALLQRESIRASEMLELSQSEDAKSKFLERYGSDVEFDPKQFSLYGVKALGARINSSADMGFLAQDHDYRLVYVGDEMDLSKVSVPKSKCYDYMFAGLPVTNPASFPNIGESFEGTYFKTGKLIDPGLVPVNAKNVSSMYEYSGIETAPALGQCRQLETTRNAFIGCFDMKAISTLPDSMEPDEAQRMFTKNIGDYDFVEDTRSVDIARYVHPDDTYAAPMPREEIEIQPDNDYGESIPDYQDA